MALLGRVGLDDHATEPVGLLPPAMQRRLALALALVSDPRLLLLDDPFGGLSTEDRAAFAESIRGLHANGLTVILAARELEAATALADRLLVLDRGALIASGPPERVCRDPRVIAACGHEARVVSRT